MSGESDFAALAEELLTRPGVETGTGFGKAPGLRVNGKIFAMLIRDQLVVKLPAARCEALREAGAESLKVGKREMREWVAVSASGPGDWPALTSEALEFVGGDG